MIYKKDYSNAELMKRKTVLSIGMLIEKMQSAEEREACMKCN